MLTLSPAAAASAVGRSVGWRVTFRSERLGSLEFDHRHCWSDMTIALDSGLSPGSVEITIRGMTPEDFRRLAMARLPRETASGERSAGREPLFGTVQLFWRDRVGQNPDVEHAPVIAHFAVTALSRRNEGLLTNTTVTGRSALYDRLSRTVTAASTPPARAAGPLAAARQILTASGFVEHTDFAIPQPTGSAATGSEGDVVIQSGAQTLGQLRSLEDALLQRYQRRGRGVYLIRDAKLLVGPFRPIPAEGEVKELTGFISADMQGQDSAVATTEAVAGAEPPPRPRDVWRVKLIGRGDIKPGDVVSFRVPDEDAALFSGFGLLPVAAMPLPDQFVRVVLYVSSVRHAIGQNKGWDMHLTGVTIPGTPLDEKAWDIVSATTTAVTASGELAPRADAAGSVRSRMASIAAAEMANRPTSDVAEVRASFAQTTIDGDRVLQPAHSSDLLVGVADAGGTGAARFAEIRREGDARHAINTPYLTPFAWGPFGLVLPRYPGTRVMISYHRNALHDPVDIGALWRTDSDQSIAAPVSEPGDWWLILPAGLTTEAAQAASGTAEIAIPDSAKASHDLIDAHGERVIEVAGFTVRAYAEDSMKPPAERPQPPSGSNEQGGIVIEHVDSGAHIKITTDGKITIKATDELVLEGKGIKLKPTSGTVDVQ